MFDEIVIIGGGSLGCLIAEGLVNINNKITVTIVTRNKNELSKRFLHTDRVFIKDYSDTIEKRLPCVVTVACDESSIIKKLIDNGEGSISRYSVAPYNLRIIDSILPYLRKIDCSAHFIVTNPVEYIMGHLIENNLSMNLYGLGLDLDSRRFQVAIRMLSGILIKDLISKGTHISPVPLIDNRLDIDNLRLTISNITQNLHDTNIYEYNSSNLDIYKEFLQLLEQLPKKNDGILNKDEFLELVDQLTSILIKSEFMDGKPPVKQPAESISSVLDSFLRDGNINVSYVKNSEIIGGLIKIHGDGTYTECI